jgi:hypothetical protein
LQLEARVKNSSFRFCHFDYPGDFHLSVCANSLDQDRVTPLGLMNSVGCRGVI